MRHPYFELRDVDRRFWAERIDPFLPGTVFDAHRHIAAPEHLDPMPPERRQRNWAMEVAGCESLEEAAAGYSLLFPERSVSYLAFGMPHRECHLEENNSYLVESTQGGRAAVLALTSPAWDADRVAEWLRRPGVIGIKPYDDLIPGFAGEDVSVFAFCPHDHLRVLQEVGGWLTLHLPRKERLADPDNIAEIREIRQRYPGIVLAIAHLGRSYAGRYARQGLRALSGDEGILFDTSALLNPAVHAIAADRLGPERLLFGTDFPIMYMRGRRKWEGDRYINLTSGDYSWNVNREPPQVEAAYTLYVYEAMAACIDACRQLGFGPDALQAIFHDNARRIVDRLLSAKGKW